MDQRGASLQAEEDGVKKEIKNIINKDREEEERGYLE